MKVANSKNKYGHVYGCHTPRTTRKAVHALEDAGFKVEDVSWHNDMADRVQLVGSDIEIWMPNPEEDPAPEYKLYSIELVYSCRQIEFENITGVIEFLRSDALKLARAFSDQLISDIGVDLVKEAAKLNYKDKGTEFEACCHTHDYCDANQTMLDAFVKTFGREMRLGDDDPKEEDTDLVNKAWDIAKMADFFQSL